MNSPDSDVNKQTATTVSNQINSSIPIISSLWREHLDCTAAGRLSLWMLVLLTTYVLPGMALMAKGLLGPGMLGVTAGLLPLAFKPWRKRVYYRGLPIAFAVSLPWLLVWPLALYNLSTGLFMKWFCLNNIGRFLGFSVPVLEASHESAHLLKTVPWFTFPLLPLAVWVIWKLRSQALARAGMQVSIRACRLPVAHVNSVGDSGDACREQGSGRHRADR